MAKAPKIVGLVRFSVLGFSDWKFHRGSWVEWEEHGVNWDVLNDIGDRLFDEKNLLARFYYFEHLCLPSLVNQTNQEFELYVLTAMEMPDWALKKLEALLEPYKNFHLVALPRGILFSQTASLLSDLIEEHDAPICHFRIDDDDGLDKNYIENLSWVVTNSHDLKPLAISFGRTHFLDLNSDPILGYKMGRPFHSLGLAICSKNPRLNVFRWGHYSIIHRMRVFYQATTVNGVMLRHRSNDSTPIEIGSPRAIKNGVSEWENWQDWMASQFPKLNISELAKNNRQQEPKQAITLSDKNEVP